MTVKTSLTIHCDGPDCDCPPFTSTYDEIGAARREAAGKGWTYDPSDGTDWGRGHIRFIASGKVLS